MANPARSERIRIQAALPGASVVERGRSWIKLQHPNDPNRFIVSSFIAPIHIEGTEIEIDTAWIDADPIADAPWLKRMTLADYHAYFGNGSDLFNSGQIIRYGHPASGEQVTFQPQQLQWTNDIDQIAAIADPAAVAPTINDDSLHFQNAYGSGLNFIWETQTARLAKYLQIDSLAAIGTPSQTIINGGNAALRLQFIFQKSTNVEIRLNGQPWDEKANNPVTATGLIEFRLKSSGQPLWYFEVPTATDAADQEIPVTYRLRKTGNSLFVEVRVLWSFLQSAVYPVIIDPSTSPQVTASADDGRWDNTPLFSNASSTQQFGISGSTIYDCFQRFAVTGPAQGATINSGTPGSSGTYLTFVARLSDSTIGMNALITAIKGDDPAAPTTYSEAETPAGGRTTASVAWIFDTAWVSNSTYYSVDISSVIQEIVNQATWASGEHMVVYVEDNGSSSGAFRRGKSYDSSTTQCPILTIDYTNPVAGKARNQILAPISTPLPVAQLRI